MSVAEHRNLVFDTIEELSQLTSLPAVASVLASTMAEFGFTALGINGLPTPIDAANPIILTESLPDGFRDLYIHGGFYLADHIVAHARTAYEPFRYSEAPYEQAESAAHLRFLQALKTFGMGKGLIVPFGRPANLPVCVWLAGEEPDLDDETIMAIQLIALFAASKASAMAQWQGLAVPSGRLSPRERELLQWTAAGKTSWEISVISGLSERMVNKIIGNAMSKLDAVSRAQAVVNAIRAGEISL